jgi:hypothetical protein
MMIWCIPYYYMLIIVITTYVRTNYVCVHIYMHMYNTYMLIVVITTYVRTMCVYTYKYICTIHTHTYIYSLIHKIYTYVQCMYNTYTHSSIQIVYRCLHVYMLIIITAPHIYAYTYMPKHTHAYTYIHMHVHTCAYPSINRLYLPISTLANLCIRCE